MCTSYLSHIDKSFNTHRPPKNQQEIRQDQPKMDKGKEQIVHRKVNSNDSNVWKEVSLSHSKKRFF